jgi:hypothetical protein
VPYHEEDLELKLSMEMFEWERAERTEHQSILDRRFDDHWMGVVFNRVKADLLAGVDNATLRRRYALMPAQLAVLIRIITGGYRHSIKHGFRFASADKFINLLPATDEPHLGPFGTLRVKCGVCGGSYIASHIEATARATAIAAGDPDLFPLACPSCRNITRLAA